MRSVIARYNRPYLIAFALLSIVVALLLGQFYSKSYIHSDASQNLSVAKNISNGIGIKTDIIYYQQHHEYGSVPAVQTVFPPGLSFITAAFHRATGIPLSLSLYALCVFFFLAIPIQVFIILRRMKLDAIYSFILACTCYLFSYFWLQTLNFGSELLFIFIILLCVLVFPKKNSLDQYTYKKIFFIGMLAGLSVFVRYVGIFFVISIIIFFMTRFIFKRERKEFYELLFVGAVSSSIPILLFIRNYYITGTISGGPQVIQGASLNETLHAIRWQISMLFGFFLEGKKIGLAELLVILTFLYSGYIAAIYFLRDKVSIYTQLAQFSTPAMLSIIYIFTTVVILFLFSLTKSAGYFNARYLMTLFPFILILLADFIRIYKTQNVKITWNIRILMGLILFSFIVGQYSILPYHINIRMSENTKESLIQPLKESYIGDIPLYEYLRETTTKNNPLLTNKAQRLWVFLNQPVISFTPSLFTQTQWDEGKVSELIRRYNIDHILLYKKYYDPDKKAFSNQVFYKNLINGEIPDWLELIENNEEIMFLRIR